LLAHARSAGLPAAAVRRRARGASHAAEAGTSAIVPAVTDPAVTDAIFAATGKRLRKLPIDITALKQPG
jgi:CO/xanthine dehydrogenase Mo-binding subunit